MIFMKTQSNFYLFLIALISAMGGFLFGYDWVVIGGAKPFYEQYFGIANDPVMQGWAMSSALIGCLFGALSAGKLSDRLGRKPILILAAGLFICTAVGTGAVHSFTFFNVFRLVGGFAIGIASSLSPMYIAEIAPAHLRGRFVSINQLTVVLGILTSQIVNWQIAEPVALGATHEMIRESWNGQMGWRWMFWAMTVPAALFFVFSFILPESPRWLASSGKREAALKASAEVLRAAMLQKGFDLILVSSIWEAKRRIFEDKEIELILCDLELPDGTAMELFHTLRRVAGMFQMKNPPVRLLPFFILTENNDPATEYEYRHEGVNDYITAPVNIPELIRQVLFFVE